MVTPIITTTTFITHKGTAPSSFTMKITHLIVTTTPHGIGTIISILQVRKLRHGLSILPMVATDTF